MKKRYYNGVDLTSAAFMGFILGNIVAALISTALPSAEVFPRQVERAVKACEDVNSVITYLNTAHEFQCANGIKGKL